MNGITDFFNRLVRGMLRLLLFAALTVFLLSLLAATFFTAAQHSNTIQSHGGVQRKRLPNFSAHFYQVRGSDPQPVHALRNAHPLVVSPCCGIIFSLTSKGVNKWCPEE